MRKNVPDEPNISEILTLLCSLDGGLLKAIHAQGVPIILVTAVPVARFRRTMRMIATMRPTTMMRMRRRMTNAAARNTSLRMTVPDAASTPAPNAAPAFGSTLGRNLNEQYHLPGHGEAWQDHHSL